MNYSKTEISELIYLSLQSQKEKLEKQFLESSKKIGFFYLDDLLPTELALKIYENFPDTKELKLNKNIREYKFVGYQMNKYIPLLEEVIYAFQEKKVVDLVAEICNIKEVQPDTSLYAGGLSSMERDNFLNPHLDNSHDKDLKLWRVLNLLYYVTPNWKIENGGNLELWQNGIKQKPITIKSKFNRLVVMATHQKSWHSVSKITVNKARCCVSNYYFSKLPVLPSDTFHVTTFRAKPNEKIKDFILQTDGKIRNLIRKVFKKGIRKTPHQYKK